MADYDSIDVVREAFHDFDQAFVKLDQNTQDLLSIRSGLRNFFDPSFGSHTDVSSRYLFPVCRYLIQSLCFLKFESDDLHACLVNAVKFAARKDAFKLAHNTIAYTAVRAIIDPNQTGKLSAFHSVGISHASFAKNQTFLSSTHFPRSGHEANAKYDDAVAHVAKACVLDCETDFDRLFATPLWHDLGQPFERDKDLPTYREFHRASTFAYWRRWYQGLLDGVPLDRELQRRVALISGDIWDSGPEAVAREIAQIETKWELEREVVALKEQLAKVKQLDALPSRLHNQPPEAIDDTIGLFQKDVTLIWDKLDELVEEVQKSHPSPSRLLLIAKWLAKKATTMAKYCGSVADDWLRAGGKAFFIAAGTAAGSAAVAAVSLPDGMKTVSELIEKLVALIGG